MLSSLAHPTLRGTRYGLLVVMCWVAAQAALAQSVVFNEVRTIAAPTTGVPVEHTFTVNVAGDYQVTLTDLGAQLNPSAPLASVKLAVTSGNALVGSALVGAGTLDLKSLPQGDYQLHVVGMPGTGVGSGTFGIKITSTADGSTLFTSSDTLAVPTPTATNGQKVLDDSFTVASAGNYVVSLTDLKLPVALTTLTLALTTEGGSSLLVTLPDASNAMQATVALQTGVTYRIFAAGIPDATANAGLYSAVVAPSGGGAPVYQSTLPLGSTTALGSTPLTAGSYTFSLTDLMTPVALASVQSELVLNGQSATQLAAAGNQSFTAVDGTYLAFGVASAAATPGAGSYAVQVTAAGGSAVFGTARAVMAAGSTQSAYSFDTPSLAAGTYVVRLTDFLFPAPLTSFSVAAVQNGTLLAPPLKVAGNLNITAAAGPVSLLVFAQGATAGGLFGTDVTPSAGGDPVFEVTQGVGHLFTARKFSITNAAEYQLSVTDVGFPAKFSEFAVIVTRGTSSVGQAFGGGAFPFAATSGNYFINFFATPADPDDAGTYAMTVGPAPPAPVVNFTASTDHVASGGTVTLNWTTQNATACTAKDGWSGTQPLSGPVQSGALTTTTKFTLSCSGPGGTTDQSVTVTVDPPSSGGHGGGGALDLYVLFALCGALLVARRGRAYMVALSAICLSLVGVTAHAAAAGSVPQAEVPAATASKITAMLKERFPDAQINSIHRSPLNGLFEVVTADEIVYVNESADLLFVGRIIDPVTKENLSTQHWNQYNAIDFSTLPTDLAIKIVKGDGSRTLAIFEDPRCPYCKQLEEQMAKMTNVTVYVFLYPLESIHEGATEIAERIWCSEDRATAWSSWMLKGSQPGPKPAPCDTTAVNKALALGNNLHINSTPTLFFADGSRGRGAMSVEQLETALNGKRPGAPSKLASSGSN